MTPMRVCVSSLQYSIWRSNKIFFLVVWSWGLHFWRESKINSRCHWRCVLSRRILSQQREMRIYWWLWNISEIHLWMWKVWSQVICSQSSFYVTRARKDDKNRQNTLFFARKIWIWYPKNNFYLLFRFNQTNIERKNCVWTTKYKILSEMCSVQHVEMKSVFTFQPIKRLLSTTVKSAKPAAMFWKILLRTKNRQFCCLAVMVHIVLQDGRVATTKKNNHRFFRTDFSANHSHPHQKRPNWVQIWNKLVLFLLADDLSRICNFKIIVSDFNLQSTSQI